MSNIFFRPIIPIGVMLAFLGVCILIILLNRKQIIVRIIMVLLLFVISQRPMLRNGENETYNLDLDIMFVIDTSVSMNAIDVNNDTRLNAVIKDCLSIISELPGASYAIVKFDNYSMVRIPFTNDSGVIQNAIKELRIIEPNYASGSSFELPYSNMKRLLDSSSKKDKHQRIVFFIGDGELTSNESKMANFGQFKDIAPLIDNGAVLGYGTSTGGKMIITDSVSLASLVDANGFLLDRSKNPAVPAISKMDESNLKKIADYLSLDYFHMTDISVLKNKLVEIKNNAVENEEDTEYSHKDLYYYFSLALLIISFYELYYYRRNEQ